MVNLTDPSSQPFGSNALLLIDKHRSHSLLTVSNNSSFTSTTHHSAANAHARHKDLLLLPLRLGKRRRNLSRPGTTQRMANGDSSSHWIDFVKG